MVVYTSLNIFLLNVYQNKISINKTKLMLVFIWQEKK